MIRILFTIPNFTTAGSGRAMVNIIDRLDRTRFEPTVAVRARAGAPVAHLESTGVEVIEADLTVAPRPAASLPWRAWKAGAVFRGRFDLWHSFNYSDDYTEPVIAYLAGARGWIYTKKNMSWGGRAWWVRSLLARRIAVQNEAMLERFFPSPVLRWKCRYVPRGIDVDGWRNAAPKGWRTRLGIADDAVVAVCVGHIQPRKNQARVTAAAASVPGLHLLLAGDVLDEAEAEGVRTAAQRAGAADRVHLLGNVDDVAGLLAECDVFVLASHAEGSPVAVLEAMAAGVPGVYSAIPGIVERVENGLNGLLVDPFGDQAIADALEQLATSADLRRSVAQAALQRAAAVSIDVEVGRHESLYTELSRPPSPASRG